MDVPGSLELTRPGRGNFDLYEDGLAPQGWILFPEGGPSEEQKRGADVSAPLSCLLGPPSTPPVDVPGSLELTRPGRGNFDLYEDGLAPQGLILSPRLIRGWCSPSRVDCPDIISL